MWLLRAGWIARTNQILLDRSVSLKEYFKDIFNRLIDRYIDKIMTFQRVICYVLLIVEVLLAYTHFNVLIGTSSIIEVSHSVRMIYFSTDMISVLLCFYMTGLQNQILTAIHFLVHSTAVAHLCNAVPTYFYAEVFRLAELKSSTALITNIYILLTSEDILCHLVNVGLMSMIIWRGTCQQAEATIRFNKVEWDDEI